MPSVTSENFNTPSLQVRFNFAAETTQQSNKWEMANYLTSHPHLQSMPPIKGECLCIFIAMPIAFFSWTSNSYFDIISKQSQQLTFQPLLWHSHFILIYSNSSLRCLPVSCLWLRGLSLRLLLKPDLHRLIPNSRLIPKILTHTENLNE